MDFLRWFYYHIKLKTGIADTYRYEQFMKKNDKLYDFDHLLVFSNLNSTNKEKVLENLLLIEIFLILKFHVTFTNFMKNFKLQK
jgi:hypothetical protein